MKLKIFVLGTIAGLFLTACGGPSPEDTTEEFVKALSVGDCDKALTLATGNAEESVKAFKESGCKPSNDSLVGPVTCEINDDEATCSCELKTDVPWVGEKTFTYIYNLKKVDGSWKVSNYSKDINSMIRKINSPKETTEAFVNALSYGDCDIALLLTTEQAKEAVIAIKESGCEATKDEIIGDITCEIKEDKATCSCKLKSNFLGENTYNYDLEKVDGYWKIYNYSKDIRNLFEGIEEIGDTDIEKEISVAE